MSLCTFRRDAWRERKGRKEGSKGRQGERWGGSSNYHTDGQMNQGDGMCQFVCVEKEGVSCVSRINILSQPYVPLTSDVSLLSTRFLNKYENLEIYI